jgi:hypothetical protein
VLVVSEKVLQIVCLVKLTEYPRLKTFIIGELAKTTFILKIRRLVPRVLTPDLLRIAVRNIKLIQETGLVEKLLILFLLALLL